MQKSGKLELTWVGKHDKKRIEPRILVEDPKFSYGNPNNANMLIHGDNLLALQALQRDFAGRIKCIYIDPPFNTGSRIDSDGKEVGYEDGVEHSIWLTMMKERLHLLNALLTPDGVIFVHIDDKEMAYLRILMDEVFHRRNFLNMIVVKTSDPSGHKTVNPSPYSQTEYILMYAKDRSEYKYEQRYVKADYDPMYNRIITNVEQEYSSWVSESLSDYFAKQLGYTSTQEAKEAIGELDFQKQLADYAFENASKVYQATAISSDSGRELLDTKEKSLLPENKDRVFWVPREAKDDVYILNGRQIYFYSNKIKNVDGTLVPAKPLTNLWLDIPWNGIANEGGVTFKNGKKPEKLLRRIIEMSTNESDYVLDSFLGSGTTVAVAHKMRRKWIGIEMGPHCFSHSMKRINAVIDGEKSGVSKLENWKGGGGYKFYELAPSLLVKNPRLPIYQINPEYTFEMMCEAICKIEGFRYAPDGVYHGHSSEKRFIYITKEFVNAEYIQSITTTLGEDQSLLIYGTKIQSDMILPDNIEVKRIPKDLLEKCDFESEVR